MRREIGNAADALPADAVAIKTGPAAGHESGRVRRVRCA